MVANFILFFICLWLNVGTSDFKDGFWPFLHIMSELIKFWLGILLSFCCVFFSRNSHSFRAYQLFQQYIYKNRYERDFASITHSRACRPILMSAAVSLKAQLSPFLLDAGDGCCAPIAYRIVQRDLPLPPCSLSTVNGNNALSWRTVWCAHISTLKRKSLI